MIEIFDTGVLEFFQQIHHPVLTVIYRYFTTLGNAGMIWIVVGLLLLIQTKTRKYGCILLISLLLCLLFGNAILKNLVARPRPCWRHPEVPMLLSIPKDYSFPSGHTLSSVACAVSLYYWNHRYGCLAFVVALLIITSRLYFFVHYPTDILAGIILGVVVACVSIWIVEYAGRKKEVA